MTQHREHSCHAVGCAAPVPPKSLMCKGDWLQVPRRLREAVMRVYRPGQEVTKDPSPIYVLVADYVVGWLAVRQGRWTDAQLTARVVRQWKLWSAKVSAEDAAFFRALCGTHWTEMGR